MATRDYKVFLDLRVHQVVVKVVLALPVRKVHAATQVPRVPKELTVSLETQDHEDKLVQKEDKVSPVVQAQKVSPAKKVKKENPERSVYQDHKVHEDSQVHLELRVFEEKLVNPVLVFPARKVTPEWLVFQD